MEKLDHNYISIVDSELRKNGASILKRINSKTNLVFLCNVNGNKRIIKVYQNKYFKNQAIYEAKVNQYLNDNKFSNTAKIYRTFKLRNINLYCNEFEYLNETELSELMQKYREMKLAKAIKILKDLHKIPVPTDLFLKHPQERDRNPMCFIMDYTISKLKKQYQNFDNKMIKYLTYFNDFEDVQKKFCHRDPNYKHILTRSNKVHIIDFEDAGAFPPQVDFASLLKDMIEYGESIETISQYLKSCRLTTDAIWEYLIHTYLLDFAYLSNPIFIPYPKFQQIVESYVPEQALGELVKINEINSRNR